MVYGMGAGVGGVVWDSTSVLGLGSSERGAGPDGWGLAIGNGETGMGKRPNTTLPFCAASNGHTDALVLQSAICNLHSTRSPLPAPCSHHIQPFPHPTHLIKCAEIMVDREDRTA